MTATLPQYSFPLLGRQREIESTLALLRQTHPPVRLITLTGPGGVGKTHLAAQIASEWQYAEGGSVFFVPLASVNDPTLVIPAIAFALDVYDSGSMPVGDSLADFLRNKQCLLVLDNFEHVLPAAPLIAGLLTAAPQLTVLTASRTPLHLPEEVDVPVPPLVVPDLDNLPSVYMLANYAAVALFLQRAKAVDPQFTLNQNNAVAVAEVCAHLDGLPLAIELAAARIKSITPLTMRERLQSRLMLLVGGKHLDPRHQSLRAAIDWSYELLNRGERMLFTRLAVFAGSGSETCIRTVCNDAGDLPLEVSDGLSTLVDQNMIQLNEGRRYCLLETIREYALERLAERGEDGRTRRLHAIHFVGLAEMAETKLRGPEQQYWLDRLEAELENFRAALGWTLDSEEHELGLRLAGALRWFWIVRGHLTEGRDWIAKLSAFKTHTPGRAKALNTAAVIALPLGDFEQARALSEESLAISQAGEDSSGIADSLYGLGRVSANFSRYAEAIALYEKSLALYRELNDRSGIADVLFNLGRVAIDQGEPVRARALYEESLQLRRESGDQWGTAHALTGLAYLTADTHDFPTARALSEECLAIYRTFGDRSNAASMQFNLGYIAAEQGDHALAESLYLEALATWQELGKRTLISSVYRQLCYLMAARGDWTRAEAYGMEGLALTRQLGIKWSSIRLLTTLGWIASGQERYSDAAALLNESLKLAREIDDKLGAAAALKEMGWVALSQANNERAAELLGESLRAFRRSSETKNIIGCLEGLASAVAGSQPGLAVRLWAAADSSRRAMGLPLEPARQTQRAKHLAAVRAALEETAFAAAWVDGQALSLEQAVTDAIGI